VIFATPFQSAFGVNVNVVEDIETVTAFVSDTAE
jgi:hypothetical protein